uniref:CSON003216 protein n=1 Tax=Culicoides sonorensis TaxID=179676 RepID=A0A336KHM1_CULSO
MAKMVFNSNHILTKYLSLIHVSVSEEGNEEQPGSDDSHATVVQSVTEENERSPSTDSGRSGKKSDQGVDNDSGKNEEVEDEQEENEADDNEAENEQEENEQEEEQEEEDEGINNDVSTNNANEDDMVVEDIEDGEDDQPPPEPEQCEIHVTPPEPEEIEIEIPPPEPEEVEIVVPPPEPEEVEIEIPPPEPEESEIEVVPPEPEPPQEIPQVVEQLPSPPQQFSSSIIPVKAATSPPPVKSERDQENKKLEKTTTIEIEKLENINEKITDRSKDKVDLKNQQLPTTSSSTISNTNQQTNVPSTSSATKVNDSNDSQIITVPLNTPPPSPSKKLVETKKKPLPDISKPPKNLNDRRYDDDPDKIWNCGAWFEYILVVVVSSLLLLAATVLTLFWAIYYRQGFDLTDADKKFNLHPVLMIGGYITLSGFSIILYRICRCCSHLMVKLLHALFHALAIPCIVVGFLIVWDYKNQTGTAHFYSLHSWLGLITMGLFGLQFILGFFSFLVLLCCDNATYKFRSVMVPIHAIFGIVTFMLAIATALTGFLQKARFDLDSDYNLFAEEGIVVNTIGVVLIGLGCIVPFAVRRANSPANSRVYVTERL